MSDQPHRTSPSPSLAALAAWVVPGAGYLLLRDFSRGLTVGITIILLFVFGLLIGGIRCLEVPGYDAHGHKQFIYRTARENQYTEHLAPDAVPPNAIDGGWTLFRNPIGELRAKPWNIPQIMVGPLDVLCDWWCIAVSHPIEGDSSGQYEAVRSHARVNELGILFTAVAGLLNLLAIIDTYNRASLLEGV